MKKTTLGILLMLTSLVLSVSACANRHISESGTGEVPIVSADRAAGTPLPQPLESLGEEEETRTESDIAELEIHFLDVGQGDCTLLLCDGEAMLIDAGDNDQGTKIQRYLQKQGVEKLKYVVCTHPDEDHIGGMDVILYKFPCETVLMTEEEKDTNTYRDVIDTMNNRNYQRTQPVIGQQYSLGDAAFTLLGPAKIGEDSNNNSIALLMVHGSNRFLFTGDAEEEEEEALLECGISLDADVYKAGHHGSRTSSSQAFLEAVSPAYVVISCGEGNSYGHPHAETMNSLRAMGAEVFRTDEQGSIVLYSDGNVDDEDIAVGAVYADRNDRGISWNCSPSETWLAGEPYGTSGTQPSGIGSVTSGTQPPETGSDTPETQPDASVSDNAVTPGENSVLPEAVSYICNTNTHKFHYPDCSSVGKMKEKNKLSVTATREEMIGQGYDPCKICKP